MRRAITGVSVVLLVAVALVAFVAPTSHPAGADEPLDKSIKPDVVLSAGQTWNKVSKDLIVGDEVYSHSPAECRTPPYDLVCDSYRIKLNRNLGPDALNFVFFTLEFEPIFVTPDAAVIAAGLARIPVGDYDVYVYDKEDHYLGQNYPGLGQVNDALGTVSRVPVVGKPTADFLGTLLLGDEDPTDYPPGGRGVGVPERGGFTANQDVYDVVIAAKKGVQKGYTLRLGFSDEEFATPFELLDPEVSDGGFGSDITDVSDVPEVTAGSDAALPEANVAPDNDIAGVGLGAAGRFDAPPSISVSGARSVAATPKAPSAVVLILAMVVLPVAGLGSAFVVLRRRRQALV